MPEKPRSLSVPAQRPATAPESPLPRPNRSGGEPGTLAGKPLPPKMPKPGGGAQRNDADD